MPPNLAALARIPGVEVVQSRAFDRRRSGLAAALAFGLDRAAAAEFQAKQHRRCVRIRAVFRLASAVSGGRLVSRFSASPACRICFRRPRDGAAISAFAPRLRPAGRILLSSESALRDCRKFYPGLATTSRWFGSRRSPRPTLLAANPADVMAQYGLPPQYFYLPNQFWRHKNHQVVVDALAILKSAGLDVVVAASGSTEDPREPDYFERLDEAGRSAAALKTNFRYLGMIPLAHVYALLRSSTALINPSRFEGWSTTVEEAKSFGVPMILSDIDVHREQTGGTARYFGVDDPQALADHLSDAFQGRERVIAPTCCRISMTALAHLQRNLSVSSDAPLNYHRGSGEILWHRANTVRQGQHIESRGPGRSLCLVLLENRARHDVPEQEQDCRAPWVAEKGPL